MGPLPGHLWWSGLTPVGAALGSWLEVQRPLVPGVFVLADSWGHCLSSASRTLVS
jgi:hypothetical protein